MTTTEAAAALGLSLRQVQTLIQRGTLPARKVGRDWWLDPADVEAARRRPRRKARVRA